MEDASRRKLGALLRAYRQTCECLHEQEGESGLALQSGQAGLGRAEDTYGWEMHRAESSGLCSGLVVRPANACMSGKENPDRRLLVRDDNGSEGARAFSSPERRHSAAICTDYAIADWCLRRVRPSCSNQWVSGCCPDPQSSRRASTSVQRGSLCRLSRSLSCRLCSSIAGSRSSAKFR